MITAIEGTLEARGDDWVVVKVGGVSLRLQLPTPALAQLGEVGRTVRLHTYLQVKEDGIALYGFASAEELELFQMLIRVAGVGPRIALSFLSALAPERLALAIASGDTEVLALVPGVGKKMAARLVLELKGKLERPGAPLALHDDVLAALTSLGYSLAEATSAIATLPSSSELPLEEKIKLALQHLAKA